MTTLQRQARPALLSLRRRFHAGGRVTLAEAFAAAGLTPCQRDVIRERLAGRSYGSIGGRARSRQAVQAAERLACGRLGLAGSIETTVHADERADQAERYAAHARGTNAAELHADERPARQRLRKLAPREVIQARLDAIAETWLTAGEVERAMLRAEADRLARRLARLG